MQLEKGIDAGSLIVIIITFVLFVLALLSKGFTHDLLLEAGVFLVSVKLIVMAYKSSVMKQSLDRKLDAIHEAIVRLEACASAEREMTLTAAGDEMNALGGKVPERT